MGGLFLGGLFLRGLTLGRTFVSEINGALIFGRGYFRRVGGGEVIIGRIFTVTSEIWAGGLIFRTNYFLGGEGGLFLNFTACDSGFYINIPACIVCTEAWNTG